MFPIWTIALIIIIVITAIIIAIFFIRRRRSRSLSVHTIHERDEEETKEKKSVSTGSFQTLVTQKQHSVQLPLPNTPQLPTPHESEAPEQPPQEIKISLPLPPPTTSFFSDKMELDAQDLFDMYLNSKKKKEEGFLQQKAATIKSTLRQSMRLQQKNNKNSVLDVFVQPVLSDSEPSITLVKEQERLTKTNIELPHQPKQQLQQPQINTINNDHIVIIDNNNTNEEDESPITPNPHLQEPIRAAKRVLRSASRKTKTRSVTNNNQKSMSMDSIEKIAGDYQEPLEEEEAKSITKKATKHESVAYNSIRGLKGNNEHMTLTSGSIRRFMRESTNVLNSDEEQRPLPTASTRKSIRKSGGISASEITSWWDDSKQHQDQKEKASNDNTPHQYRASLNTSIFANTLSRASGSSTSLFADTNNSKDDGGAIVSRHNSFRKGTLGRNTLKSITASATNGVNKSLKGLFDYTSTSSNTSSNKIIPDDSQKMELNDEPSVFIAEEKLAIGQHDVYPSIRDKSIRTLSTTSSRPSLPQSYVVPVNTEASESSTKYALSDEEEMDLSSKKSITRNDEYTEKHHVPNTATPYTGPNSKPIKHIITEKSFSPTNTATTHSSPVSPITAIEEADHSSPSLVSLSQPGDIDAIRRVLQDTWMNHMKESGSSYSMLSDTSSLASPITAQQSPTNKVNPRQQQQQKPPQSSSQLTKSLLSQQVAKRASLLARQRLYYNNEDDFSTIQGPEPSASFSSSTVRTMIPEQEQHVVTRQNAIQYNKSNGGSTKIQEESLMTTEHNNGSNNSSRGHSRKSSGANSAATALRISNGYAANAKTWNGRKSGGENRPSIVPQSPEEENNNSRAFFSTMRKGQKSRGNIPWMISEEKKTPAQLERDRYLEGKF